MIFPIRESELRASTGFFCRRYFWSEMNPNIAAWAKGYFMYQRLKVHLQTNSKPGKFEVSTERFDDIHLDLLGPLPISFSNAAVDQFSR